MHPDVNVLKTEILSDNWYILKKITYEYTNRKGERKTQQREVYDRGNGATILLYNKVQQTIVLTRQLRIPTYVNGNTEGLLIETCAGLLDRDNPEAAILRETEEETGYKIRAVEKVFEAYMSPGSVTEILYFFIGEYNKTMKVSHGGGVEDEQEEIEVMEIPFAKALAMVKDGVIKDGKTIMLLQYAQLNNIL